MSWFIVCGSLKRVKWSFGLSVILPDTVAEATPHPKKFLLKSSYMETLLYFNIRSGVPSIDKTPPTMLC